MYATILLALDLYRRDSEVPLQDIHTSNSLTYSTANGGKFR